MIKCHVSWVGISLSCLHDFNILLILEGWNSCLHQLNLSVWRSLLPIASRITNTWLESFNLLVSEVNWLKATIVHTRSSKVHFLSNKTCHPDNLFLCHGRVIPCCVPHGLKEWCINCCCGCDGAKQIEGNTQRAIHEAEALVEGITQEQKIDEGCDFEDSKDYLEDVEAWDEEAENWREHIFDEACNIVVVDLRKLKETNVSLVVSLDNSLRLCLILKRIIVLMWTSIALSICFAESIACLASWSCWSSHN